MRSGLAFVRQDGSHRIYFKEGMLRPVIVPAHKEVSVGVIQSCLRTAGISRDEYFRLLS